MIAIVPVQNVERSIRPNLQSYWHAPGIIRGEKIGFAFSEVSRSISLQPVDIDRSRMNVSNANALAVFRRIGICVEIDDAAVGRFLMAVVSNRADWNRKRWECAGLPLVLTGFDKME